MGNQLQALDEAEINDTVIKHLNVLYAARRAYTKAESSDTIKRALCYNVKTSGEQILLAGDRVFYKRDDNRLHGPDKVIGLKGKVVFIKHGSQSVRVATCRVININETELRTYKKEVDRIHGEDKDINHPEEKQDNELISFEEYMLRVIWQRG